MEKRNKTKQRLISHARKLKDKSSLIVNWKTTKKKYKAKICCRHLSGRTLTPYSLRQGAINMLLTNRYYLKGVATNELILVVHQPAQLASNRTLTPQNCFWLWKYFLQLLRYNSSPTRRAVILPGWLAVNWPECGNLLSSIDCCCTSIAVCVSVCVFFFLFLFQAALADVAGYFSGGRSQIDRPLKRIHLQLTHNRVMARRVTSATLGTSPAASILK